METKTIAVVGLMSGSSLDGLDIALCDFEYKVYPEYQLLDWSIRAGATIPYHKVWQARLRTAPHLPANELWRLHADFGKLLGQETKQWMLQQGFAADLVGSHGHTVFHDPTKGFTTQIGDGAQIAYCSGIKTVSDLRTTDIAAGGQGAPIAPLADQYLFPNYQAFLNIGGIANVSLKLPDGTIVAGDISGANQVLNRLAQIKGKPYDHSGLLAQQGQLQKQLMHQLGQLSYHQRVFPKSLDNAWVSNELWNLVDMFEASVEDKLHTFCHFLANQINKDLVGACQIHQLPVSTMKVLATGGGVHNTFLMRCLQQLSQDEHYNFVYEAPSSDMIDFKEAALVALCALHRQLGLPNALATATGAQRDTTNGALYLP